MSTDLGPPLSVTLLGRGGDHDAWLVDAEGHRWVVRVARPPSVGHTPGVVVCELTGAVRESVAAEFSAWVPEHRLVGPDRWLAHRLVEGRPLQDLMAASSTLVDPSALARRLGEFVAAIEDVTAPSSAPTDDLFLVEWLDEVVSVADGLLTVIGSERCGRVREFAAEPPPDVGEEQLRLCHNDLGAEHVVIDPSTGTISGVIDWSDAAVSDPAGDVGRILRDLGHDAMTAALVAVPEPHRHDRAKRARWYARCLVVEDLDFAVQDRPDLLPVKIETFDRLFAPASSDAR